MKWVLLFTACAGLGAFSACANSDRRPREAPARMVAFDNVYGKVVRLPVHVKVDEGVEQSLIAACDDKTCTFTLPLSNARHEVLISVEQNGQRSAPTKVTLDTSEAR